MDLQNYLKKIEPNIEGNLKFPLKKLSLIENIEEDNCLTFIDKLKYTNKIYELSFNLTILVNSDFQFTDVPENINIIKVSDSRWVFYTLHNEITKISNPYIFQSQISPSALIHESASIENTGVVIGESTIIGPFVTISRGSKIGKNCIIQAGAKIGESGFEFKRTSKGILAVNHESGTTIEDNVQVGANSTVGRGFLGQDTIIGKDTKIDFGVSIAHRSKVGSGVFIAAGAVISGNVKIGDLTWIGPSATLSNSISIGAESFVAIGSVVLSSCPPKSRLLGVPAKQIGF